MLCVGFSPPELQDSEKRTALHAAAYRGEADCITVLVQAGLYFNVHLLSQVLC